MDSQPYLSMDRGVLKAGLEDLVCIHSHDANQQILCHKLGHTKSFADELIRGAVLQATGESNYYYFNDGLLMGLATLCSGQAGNLGWYFHGNISLAMPSFNRGGPTSYLNDMRWDGYRDRCTWCILGNVRGV